MITSRPLNESPEARVWAFPSLAATWQRAVAVVFWGVGCRLTYATVHLKVSDVASAVAVAVALQLALTKLESSLWRRYVADSDGAWYKRAMRLSAWPALLCDLLLNVPGVWGTIKDVHAWPSFVAIAEMGNWHMQPLRGLAAVAVTFALAGILCAVPELLWHHE